MNPLPDCNLVIFGGTGDLTHRKLIPAIYHLYAAGMMPVRFTVTGTGRSPKSHEQYRNELAASLRKHSRRPVNEATWSALADQVFYHALDASRPDDFQRFRSTLEARFLEHGSGRNVLYYLSVSPQVAPPLITGLRDCGLVTEPDGWHRLLAEKPFGYDLESARHWNAMLREVFEERELFRIDHYLGKEMLQSLMAIRFANPMLEHVWNGRMIDNVQITLSETVGVETRGEFYDQSGALRDMVQSHMLQLLALVAMEPPASLSVEDIRAEKLKLLRTLRQSQLAGDRTPVVFGQYQTGSSGERAHRGYAEEPGVRPGSRTETFVAMKTGIRNFRWADTPFYLRTGKRMPDRSAFFTLEFKPMPHRLFDQGNPDMMPNLLTFFIQPREGVSFRFHAKEPGTSMRLVPVDMEFCQNCSSWNNSPEAYEKLLLDAMADDHTLFAHWDEIELCWQLTDAWRTAAVLPPEPYAAGSRGPVGADTLLERDGRHWWDASSLMEPAETGRNSG